MANDTELTGLIVKIKGDLTDYQSKLDAMQSQTVRASDNVVKSFDTISNTMAKAGVTMGAFAATAVSSAMAWGSAVNKLAKQTGMGADEASKFLVVAKRVGIDTDTASMMFAKLAKSINTATKEQITANAEGKKAGDVFTQLGVKTLDVNGHMRNSSDIFADVKAKLAGMQNGWQKTAIEMELFGKTGYQLNGLINMTSAEMKDAIDMAQSLGLILDDKTAPAWAKLSKEINASKGVLSSTGITIGNELMPMFKEVINDITSLTKAFTSMNPEVRSGVIEIAKLGGEIGIASGVITRTIGVIGGVTEALGLMKLATIGAAGPWVTLAAAIVIAINALDKYAQAKYKVDSYNKDAEVRELKSDDGKTTQLQVKRQKIVYGIPVNSWENATPEEEEAHIAFKNRPEPVSTETPDLKVNTDPFIGGDPNAGSSTTKTKEKTDLQKYIEQLKDVEDILNRQSDLGEISKDQVKVTLESQLEGLKDVVVGQDEVLDKERATYDLKTKLRQVERDQIETAKAKSDRDFSERTITETQYFEQRKKELQDEINLDAEGSAKRYNDEKALRDFINSNAEKQLNRSFTKINGDQEFATANLKIEAEQLRHKQAMNRIGDWQGDTASKLQSDEYDEKVILLKQYEIDVKASNDRIAEINKANLQTKTQDTDKELEQQKKLQQKYNADIIALDNNLVERQKQLEKNKIDANNATISALIKGTQTGHDVLKDMWYKFVDQVVAKRYSINAETNIFTQLLGGLFGIGGTTSTTGSTGAISFTGRQNLTNTLLPTNFTYSAAGGFDVPDIAGDIPTMLHRREMVLPESLANVIRGSANNRASGDIANATGVGIKSNPGITFNIINNTDSEVSSQNTNMSFDGENYICDVVLNKIDKSPAYARNLNTALGR